MSHKPFIAIKAWDKTPADKGFKTYDLLVPTSSIRWINPKIQYQVVDEDPQRGLTYEEGYVMCRWGPILSTDDDLVANAQISGFTTCYKTDDREDESSQTEPAIREFCELLDSLTINDQTGY